MGEVAFISAVVLLAACVSGMHAGEEVGQPACPHMCQCPPVTANLVVNCSGQNLTGIPEHIPELTTELNLSNNNISDLHALPMLPFLHTLHIGHNYISSLEILHERVPNLDYLDSSNNGIKSAPSHIPHRLKVLKLSRNHISQIPVVAEPLQHLSELYLDYNMLETVHFIETRSGECSFPRLQKLSLAGNKLQELPDHAFVCLTKLQAMTLSENELTSLGPNSLKGLSELSYLSLARNKISVIVKDTFKKMTNLRYLYLNWNNLPEVPHALPFLDWLDMSHNSIELISEVTSKEDLFPIDIVNLAHNPLVCDCRMLWLKELWDRKEYILKYTDVIQAEHFVPTCSAPEHIAGESWDLLSDAMFYCEKDDQDAAAVTAEYRRHNIPAVADGILDIHLAVTLGEVRHDSITVYWVKKGVDSCTWVFVQYYIFGHRSTTTMFAQVDFTLSRYVIKHLQPSTSYVICVIPKTGDEISASTMDHCVEATTITPVQKEDTSKLPQFLTNILNGVCNNVLILSIVASIIIATVAWIIVKCLINILFGGEHIIRF